MIHFRRYTVNRVHLTEYRHREEKALKEDVLKPLYNIRPWLSLLNLFVLMCWIIHYFKLISVHFIQDNKKYTWKKPTNNYITRLPEHNYMKKYQHKYSSIIKILLRINESLDIVEWSYEGQRRGEERKFATTLAN